MFVVANMLGIYDDIVVFSRTFQEHLDRLSSVLQVIQSAALRLKIEKCHFG